MYATEQVETITIERPIFPLPVDAAVLFADKKGVRKPGIEKKKMKLVAKLGFLARFLDADEKIIFVTTGCSPFTVLEQITIGAAWLIAVKRALFVFTNKRLFHIPVTTKNDYRGSVAQILYQDCRRLHVKGSALVAEYHSGKKERFSCIPRGDRAIIKRFNLEGDESDRPSERPQRNHLCPSCTQILPTGASHCPGCGLEFKNKAQALKYSVLLPGGGYFYTGHPYMGVADALVESYLLLLLVAGLALGLLGEPGVLSGALVVGLVLVLEKLLTVYHSHGFLAEFIPRDRKGLSRGQGVQAEPPAAPERTQQPEDVSCVR
jgi:hypothetical protein